MIDLYLSTLLGNVSLKIKDGVVTIKGVVKTKFIHDLVLIWPKMKKIENMFLKSSGDEIKFPIFYMIEILYGLDKLLYRSHLQTPRRTLLKIKSKIEEEPTFYNLFHQDDVKSFANKRKAGKLNIKPMPWQENYIDVYSKALQIYNLKGHLLNAAPGTGKAQPLSAKVKVVETKEGFENLSLFEKTMKIFTCDNDYRDKVNIYFKSMGDIHVGDKVLTPKNSIATVIGTYPQGIRPVYELRTEDIVDAVECDINHIWRVWDEEGNWFDYELKDLLELDYTHFKIPKYRDESTTDSLESNCQMVYIKDITYKRDEETKCILIDDPNHLYITDCNLVTHNTIASLFLMEEMECDTIVVICPKNALDRVWDKTFKMNYRKPEEIFVSNNANFNKPIPSGLKKYVFHYEYINKALEFFKRENIRKYGKIGIIVDECHNFSDIKSDRTNNLVTLTNDVLNADYNLWMSGTPFKAMSKEVIPLLSCIDPDFNGNGVKESFTEIFGNSANRGLEILAHRIGLITYTVGKESIMSDLKKYHYTAKIDLPNGDEFTVKNVREKMIHYANERMKYYTKHAKEYRADFFAGCDAFNESIKNNPNLQAKYKEYLRLVNTIHNGYDPVAMKDIVVWVNQFERKEMIPLLPKNIKDKFRKAKSVYKYPSLTVLGECLGTILGGMRVKAYSALSNYTGSFNLVPVDNGLETITGCTYKSVINNAEKKTLIFSTYIDVIKNIASHMKDEGFNPILVYGETNNELASIIQKFSNNDSINPLCATYASLSTAVPVLAANWIICIDHPFRDYIYEQAVSRAFRKGQDKDVFVVDVYLDTGNEDNITTRAEDIAGIAKQTVEELLKITTANATDASMEGCCDGMVNAAGLSGTGNEVKNDSYQMSEGKRNAIGTFEFEKEEKYQDNPNTNPYYITDEPDTVTEVADRGHELNSKADIDLDDVLTITKEEFMWDNEEAQSLYKELNKDKKVRIVVKDKESSKW